MSAADLCKCGHAESLHGPTRCWPNPGMPCDSGCPGYQPEAAPDVTVFAEPFTEVVNVCGGSAETCVSPNGKYHAEAAPTEHVCAPECGPDGHLIARATAPDLTLQYAIKDSGGSEAAPAGDRPSAWAEHLRSTAPVPAADDRPDDWGHPLCIHGVHLRSVCEDCECEPAAGMTDEAAWAEWLRANESLMDRTTYRAFLAGRQSMREDTT